ncbi:MAG: peptide-N-glycosidase F-related protein, partial [Bacteroidia bacterium]
YANTGVPRFPSTWKQRYIYNVTDFYTLLKDSATIRINYSGYSGGFTANVKFAFIEGTPERNVLGVDPLWLGAFNYGNSADPINNHIPVKALTAPANTNSSELKYTVTGHGSDNNTQCCEFSSHNYSVLLNNSVIDQRAVWRDDCGYNELYPQGGTWIYNRGNWCPGDAVNTNTHKLAGITANTSYSLDVQFAPYISTGSYGDYAMEGHVFYYGPCNHAVDASLDDVISPSNFEGHFRENPSGNSPVVHVRNAGSSAINSILFSYNVKDSVPTQFTWNGTLPSLHDTDITLNPLNTLTNLSLAGTAGIQLFTTKILSVNGSPDEDTTNNHIQSTFTVAPTWPNTISVVFKTNSVSISGPNVPDLSETTWQITDLLGNVMASSVGDSINTTYTDTITLPDGFYNLTLQDISCDGLHWWVWDQNPSYGITAGSFQVRNMASAIIPMHGYTYIGTYSSDFGCGFSQYFTTGGTTTGIKNIASKNNAATIMAYPNPAQDNVNITLNGIESAKGQLEIMDGQGRLVLQQKASGNQNVINLNGLSNGIYTIMYKDGKVPQIQTRMLIVK